MRLSVILPTFNRKLVLCRTLQHLFAQDGKPDMEIVIVDDGSTDETISAVRECTEGAPYPIHLLSQRNRGPAAARNVGIRVATGELVLFLGDDIFAASDLAAAHLNAHAAHPEENVAVLGYTTFAPEMRKTALSDYIDRSGLQFAYQRIDDPVNVSYEYFYTSNASVKRTFLLRYGLFDEEFPDAAYEDVELAYRLQSLNGLRILFEPRARAFHFHPVSIRQLERRGFVKGRSVVIMSRKHPEVFDVDRVVRLFPAHKILIKRLLFIFLIPFAEWIERAGWILRLDRIYTWIETLYFYDGIRAGQLEAAGNRPGT